MRVNVLVNKKKPLYESFDFDSDYDLDVESKNPQRTVDLIEKFFTKLGKIDGNNFLRNTVLYGYNNEKLLIYRRNLSGDQIEFEILDENTDNALYTVGKSYSSVYIFDHSSERMIQTSSDLYRRLLHIDETLDEILKIDPYKLTRDYLDLLNALVENFNKVRMNGIRNKSILKSNNQEFTLYFSPIGEDRYGLSELSKHYKNEVSYRDNDQIYGPIGYIQAGKSSEIIYSLNPLNFYRYKETIEKELLK